MCILFLYLNNNALEAEQLQLVIANNRDEYYNRPTKPADFWGSNKQFISGLDEQPGREGGTWLGLSKRGRLGILLNILTQEGPQPDKKGRGPLVTDFLTGLAGGGTEEYLDDIAKDATSYNPFNLFLLEKRSDQWQTWYYSSKDERTPIALDSGVYGASNSPMSKAWQKASRGKEKLGELVSRYSGPDQRDELRDALILLLNDKTQNLPDPVLEQQINWDKFQQGQLLLEQRSAVYVDSPQVAYGTRTNTVILIDRAGNVEFTERTMREPTKLQSQDWDTRSYKFNIDIS